MFEPTDADTLNRAAGAADNVSAKADRLLALAGQAGGALTFRNPADGAIYLVLADRAVHLTADTWNGDFKDRVPHLGNVPELLKLVTVVG